MEGRGKGERGEEEMEEGGEEDTDWEEEEGWEMGDKEGEGWVKEEEVERSWEAMVKEDTVKEKEE